MVECSTGSNRVPFRAVALPQATTQPIERPPKLTCAFGQCPPQPSITISIRDDSLGDSPGWVHVVFPPAILLHQSAHHVLFLKQLQSC